MFTTGIEYQALSKVSKFQSLQDSRYQNSKLSVLQVLNLQQIISLKNDYGIPLLFQSSSVYSNSQIRFPKGSENQKFMKTEVFGIFNLDLTGAPWSRIIPPLGWKCVFNRVSIKLIKKWKSTSIIFQCFSDDVPMGFRCLGQLSGFAFSKIDLSAMFELTRGTNTL